MAPGAPDALITADRDEVKYQLPPDRIPALVALLNRHFTPHRFRGPGANPLPGAHHFVTTIYFDTASRACFRATRADARQTLKLRAKEYYDVHPSLAEVATDARQIVKYNPLVWLELKERAGDRTRKRRLGVPKRQLPRLLAGEGLVAAEDQAALDHIAAHCRQLAEPLRADCLVNYRRLAWQDGPGVLRLTLDLGLAFYRPPADLWQRPFALTRGGLGVPCGRLEAAVLEVKYRDALPGWLLDRLSPLGARPSTLGKFERASRAAHDV
jgi:hypothetical protein